MKANVHRSNIVLQGEGPFHGHEIRLTVGLIVKNGEKTLEKCLSSLTPLLEAVPSELIITDTGSTDRTVEIARKFTDRIISFEWCGDFSAARNTGLDAARGEWFLYLDADEWFDDVAPLIEFFNSGECDGYGDAAYIQRNYNNFSGDAWSDDFVCRVFRHTPKIHFQNKVHEDFVLCPPLKMLDAFVHHYGYAFQNEEAKRTKLNRNALLLEDELKENPDNKKALFQYSEQLVEDSPEKAAQYAAHGLELERRDNPENLEHQQTRFSNALLAAYYNNHQYKEIIPTAEDALKREEKPGVFHLEFYRLCQLAAWQLKDYKTSADYGEKYRRLYPDYCSGKLDRSALIYGSFPFLEAAEVQKSLVMSGEAYLKLKEWERARSCLREVDISAKNTVSNGSFALCTDLAGEAGDWQIAVEFYGRILAQNDNGKEEAFLAHLNRYYYNFPSKRREMMAAFAAMDGGGLWPRFCRLRLAELDGERGKADALLEELCYGEERWGSLYADILWYAVSEGKNLVPFLQHVDAGDLPAVAAAMQISHEEYSHAVGGYFSRYSFDSAKALFCAVCLLERAVLSRDTKEDAALYRSVVSEYLENSAKFVRAVYRPEILSETGSSALPRAYRFGYYAGLALDAKRVGDNAAYLGNLRKGLAEYPPMKDCVQFLSEEFEQELDRKEAAATEFSILAQQVKQNIEQLIAQGDFKQAGAYTLQLAKLIPEDDDLRRYRRLTGVQPTMNELAAGLPQ